MELNAKSIRPFIGSKDFEVSRSFYRDLGFTETVLSTQLSVFKTPSIAFYLQNAYMEEWIANTMVFVEVGNTQDYYDALAALNLPSKYEGVKLVPIRDNDWGRECFLHDPSGILWHFGEFYK
ncbi:glyoxalase [Flavobacterium sp. RHBU_24]|uniref:glyoxalase n=1 Tax=Flavobacterium sp. RHBU_24 TaxID=3391185 RepID=UPI003985578D